MASEDTQSVATVEHPQDYGDLPEDIVRRWLAEIKAYDGTFSQWKMRSGKIVRRYRDEPISSADTALTGEEGDAFKSKNFNIFWSNVQTLQPALYSQLPKVMAGRRNKDRNPTARVAGEILKRCLTFEQDRCDYDEVFKAARDDHLLVARGTMWLRYEPVYGEERNGDLEVTPLPDGNFAAGEPDDTGAYAEIFGAERVTAAEDGQPIVAGGGDPYKPVIDEKVYLDHVLWSDFGHTPAPSWKQVRAVWRRAELTREQLIERFGEEIGKKVQLTKQISGLEEQTAAKFGDVFKRAEVYEVWDKTSRRAIWVSPGYDEAPLDQKTDPLGLQNFFPCPRPYYGTMTGDTLVPVPDYLEYQAQAVQLDILTQRIDRLASALRVAGAYDGSFSQLEVLVKGGENTLIPVDSWAAFADKGGLEGAISFLPIKEIAEVLVRLIETRNVVKQDLYEVTGLSDLVRGQSAPSASATAERIKGQFVTMRLDDRKKEMARFVKDGLELVAEVMAEHFSPNTLLEMSGWLDTANARAHGENAQQVAMAALQLLKDDRMRTFRVSIETDSTILEDVEFEKKTRTEFLTASGQFLQQAVPAAEQFPALRPLLGEMLMYGVRAFHKGSELEEVFEQTLEQLQMAGAGDSQKTQEANSKAQEAQAKLLKIQQDQQRDQAEIQLKQNEQLFNQQLKTREQEASITFKQKELEIRQGELKIQLEQLELERERLRQDFELRMAELTQKKEQADLDRVFQLEDHSRDRAEQAQDRIEQREHDEQMREQDRARQLEDRAADREIAINDRQEDRANSLEDRRLDGLATPEMEQKVEQQGDAFMEVVNTLKDMVKMLSAPRKLVTDSRGRPVGAELDLSSVDTEGSA